MEGEFLTKKERREIAKEKKRTERGRKTTTLLIKRLLLFGIAGVLLVFLGIKLAGFTNTQLADTKEKILEVVSNDWIKGNSEAGVTLIEYSDFECPACATYSEFINKLSEEFPENLRIIYRHFPLVSVHKNASYAAQAAEAAGFQGKFWEMHDKLFEKQNDWKEEKKVNDKLLGYARELGLDEEKFLEDFGSRTVKDKVKNNLTQAVRLGLNSTPTLFLDGKEIQLTGYEELKSLVESEI